MKFVGMIIPAALAVTSFAAVAKPAPLLGTDDQARTVAPAFHVRDDADWSVFSQHTYSVPNGYSFSPIYEFLGGPFQVGSIRARLYEEALRDCAGTIYAIDVKHDANQIVMSRYTPNRDGVVVLPANLQNVYAIGAVIWQQRPRPSVCGLEMAVKATSAPIDNPDQPGDEPAGFSFAGVATYDGGFRNNLEIPVAGSPRVSQFWVRLPEHCAGVELLEAGTVTENIYDRARLVDAGRKIFAVNGGTSRISKIILTVNGPAGLNCDVPVYTDAQQ